MIIYSTILHKKFLLKNLLYLFIYSSNYFEQIKLCVVDIFYYIVIDI